MGAYEYQNITAAVSRKMHGSMGVFDINVWSTNTVECRKNGPTQLLATFDQSIQRVSGTVADVTVSSGTVSSLAVSGNQLTITMNGVTDASLLNVGFPGIRTTAGQLVAGTLCFGVLLGDTNGDKNVNVLDLLNIKNNVNMPVSVANSRQDITAEGNINVLDLLAAKNNLNKIVGVSCP